MRLVALLLCSSALLGMTPRGQFEEQHGLGILFIHERELHDVVTVSLFDSIGERHMHSKWIELQRRDADFWKKWMVYLPFDIFHGGGEPYLVCMERRGDWYRVRLKGPRDYWVRQEDRSTDCYGKVEHYRKFELQSWDDFMADKAWVGRLDPATNPIRRKASRRSETINYDHGDCLGPIRTKGWWLEVEPMNGEGCIPDTTYNEAIFKKLFFNHGWVQWRNDSTFLLRTTY